MLTARDILNYIYCPRLIFYEKVLRQKQFQTFKQDNGIVKHAENVPSAKRIIYGEWKLFPNRLFEVSVRSVKHGFLTRADLLMWNNSEGRVVQFKPKIPDFGIPFAWKVQVCLEAICAVEMRLGKFQKGYIAPYYGGKPLCFDLDEQLIDSSVEIVKKVRKLIDDEEFPEMTNYPNRCKDCMYRGRLCEGAFDGR